MICRIEGVLESVGDGVAVIGVDSGLAYQVLLPAFATARLGASLDQRVTLHTLHYLEGSAQGANMTPRLAGFLSEADRAFFEMFTSVKGIGPRKALRAMAMDAGAIAAAIADRDVKSLQALPEIGKRTAETVIASLHGKVDRFLSGAMGRGPAAGGEAGVGAGEPAGPRTAAARDALEVLLQLGENRRQAMGWIDEVLVREPELDDAEQIITRVLVVKAGA